METYYWIEGAHQRLKELAQTIEDWAPSVLYGAVASMSLLPLVTVGDDPRQMLAGIIGNVGANLVANQLEAWKQQNATDEDVLAKQLTEEAKRDEQLRISLDVLLKKVGALDVIVQNLNADEHDNAIQT